MIRAATPADIPRLVEMGTRFLSETTYAGRVTVNPSRMSTTLDWLMGGVGAVFVSDLDGELVGMIGFLLFEHPISGESTASELFWWVEPEHRGGHGVRLLKRGEDWARAVGARTFQMVAPTEDVAHLYERLGFERLETTFQRALA